MKKRAFLIVTSLIVSLYANDLNESIELKTNLEKNKNEVIIKLNPYKKDFVLTADTPNDIEFSKKVEIFVKNYMKAYNFFKKHQYNQALESINIAIGVLPNVSIGYQLKGSIYYKEYKYLDALLNWKKALSLDPSNDELRKLIYKIEQNKKGY